MKLIHLFLAIIIASLSIQLGTAQTTSDSSDKATLYITRTSSLGAAMKFRYFVDDEFVGSFTSGKYLKLTLDPGKHLIVGHAENLSFVEADLTAGKTYVINAVPMMGLMSSGLRLDPVSDENVKLKKKVLKYLSKKKEKIITEKDLNKIDMSHIVKKSKKKYAQLKEKNPGKIGKLTKEITLKTIKK